MNAKDLAANPLFKLPMYSQENWEEACYVKMLWHIGFYDGPLSGICELPTGERAYFSQVNGETDPKRVYAILRLPPEMLAEQEATHQVFQEEVGTHTDYVYDDDDLKIKRAPHKLRDQTRIDAYFAAAKVKWDALTPADHEKATQRYNDLEVIGWFTS